MNGLKIKCLALIFLILSFQTVKAQETLSQSELEKFLDKAEQQSQNYIKVFQNLSAEEVKTKIYYKPGSKKSEKRVIKSNFIVYQSPTTKSIIEFRNVVEYNGKNVSRNDKESQKFFDNVSKIGVQSEEYHRLYKESLRFDGRYIEWGMTLDQERPFQKNIRSNFNFRVIGKEKIENRDVWIIEYEQVKNSPHILANPTADEAKTIGGRQYSLRDFPDIFRPTYPLMKGKIRLDANTAQIWRNDFRIILHPQKLSKPVEATEMSYQYQASNFGILIPKKFLLQVYLIKGSDDQTLSVTKDAEILYEYSNFSEFKAETKEYKTGN